jgi:hypothetical protein
MSDVTSQGESTLVPLQVEAPPGGLVHVPMRLGGWVCKGMELSGDNRLIVRFEVADSADRLEISVVPANTPGAVFRRYEHCAVRYRGSLSISTAEGRAEVGALVLGIAEAVNSRLAAQPGKTIAEALGRTRERGKLVFGRDALRSLLAPEIVEGVPLVEGWSLVDVYPSSHIRESHSATLELVLDFRRADLRRMLLLVQKRDDKRPSFAKTAHFSLSHIASNASDPPGADELRALVSFALQLHDHDDLEVEFPDVTSDIAPLLLVASTEGDASGARNDEVLNLAISSECHQQCAFCSIKETAPAEDGGDRVLARVFADLHSNRQRGVRAYRLNGYDPLTYTKVLDVLKRALDLGYEKCDVFSPCTTLADREFCEEVVRLMPDQRRFYVPIYGTDAEMHDRAVGRKGAFELVSKAIRNLLELVGPDGICLLSVVTKDSVPGLIPVAAFAQQHRLRFNPHMPYPSFETRTDKFYHAAPKQSDVAAVMAQAKRSHRLHLDVTGVAPCITFQAMRSSGVKLREWLEVPDRPPMLPGTEYKQERFRHRADENDHAAFHASSIPCPQAAKCSLLPACPGEMLRSYVELYGMDEFQSVSLRDLVSAT